jgi:hypothetical protein
MRGMADVRRQAAMSGLLAVVLFAVGSGIWALDMPDAGAAPDQVLAFYRDTDDRIVVGGALSLVAIWAFVWFGAELRTILSEAGDDAAAGATLGGAVLLAATGVGAESINMIAADRSRDDELGSALAQSLFEISQGLGSAATAIGTAVFATAIATGALRTRALLSRPLALLTLVLGLAVLTPLGWNSWAPSAVLLLVTAAAAASLLLRAPRQ